VVLRFLNIAVDQFSWGGSVIASLVSAPGLGVLVLRGIRNLELGVGLVAGLGIVLLAIILDRTSKAALKRINQAQNN
ncbi:hypothetical protein OU790_19065, partial [Ruegeria sp. NA]|nr:hypothetical protein [Ruegeria sp. NA]